MLYLVGLGLGDASDITLRGLEAVRRCQRVVLEAYTSVLAASVEELEAAYGVHIEVADREFAEQRVDEDLLASAESEDVAFLVVGDPFCATTHSDLQLRAAQRGVEVRVVHNANILTSVGVCGLQLYRYGECISLVFFTETWKPDSFYDKLKANRERGLHTLCLLDIRVKELTVKALCGGKKEYEPPRYMSIQTAIQQMLEVEESRQEGACGKDVMCVGVARMGQRDQKIVAGTMGELLDIDMGPPLHSLIVCGEVHETEKEVLDLFKASCSQ